MCQPGLPRPKGDSHLSHAPSHDTEDRLKGAWLFLTFETSSSSSSAMFLLSYFEVVVKHVRIIFRYAKHLGKIPDRSLRLYHWLCRTRTRLRKRCPPAIYDR